MRILVLSKNPYKRSFLEKKTEGQNLQFFPEFQAVKDSLGEGDENILLINQTEKDWQVAEIRAFFSGKMIVVVESIDEELFRSLKQEHRIEIAVSDPWLEEFWSAILEHLQAGIPQLDPMMKKLREQYDPTIPDKIVKFASLIHQFREKHDFSTAEALKNFCHKIAGNAGTYGYMMVSKTAREMEQKIQGLLASQNPQFTDLDSDLDPFFQKIAVQFQLPQSLSAVPPVKDEKTSISGEDLDIYLIDDDKDITELIKNQAQMRGLSIEVENDPAKAKEKLTQEDFYPKLLLIDRKLDGINGLDLIKVFKETHAKIEKTKIAIISAYGEMTSRIEGIRLGIDHFFQKPLDLEEFFQEIFNLLAINVARYRIMLIEDDVDFAEFVKNSLSDMSIDFCVLHEGKKVIDKLAVFSPQVLILDLNLPDVFGIDLLKCIRSDPRFKHLFIVPLTSVEEEQVIMEAYESGVEDYLVKPIDPKMLQIRIRSLLNKVEKRELFFTHDIETGLFSLSALRNYYNRFTREYHFFSIVYLFCLNSYKEITSKDIQQLANLLTREFADIHVVGTLRRGEFIIMMPKVKPKSAEKKMQEILQRESDREEIARLKLQIVIDVCIERDRESFRSLLDRLRMEIPQNQEKAAKIILIQEDVDLAKVLSGTTLMIIDDDKILLELMEYVFQQREMKVISFTEAQPAIAWLEKNPLPELLLLNLLLPDMHGFDVIAFVRKNFGNLLKIMLISGLAKESDIVEGMKKGADDYLTKPISLNILMEKIQNLLLE